MPSIAVICLFAIVPACAHPIIQKPLLGAASRPIVPAVNAYGKYAASYGANPYSKNPYGRPQEFDSHAPPVKQSQTGSSPKWTGYSPEYAPAYAPTMGNTPSGTGVTVIVARQPLRGLDSRGVAGVNKLSAGVEGVGGLSAEQLAFMERQKAARAGVSSLYEQTSPDVLSTLAAAVIGALAGFIAVTFVMRFRHSAWSTLKAPLMTVSN
jgi:hypothetical protein